MELKFDVIYDGDKATIETHFCREWDENGGCYGTNPEHGFTLDEACDIVAEWYENQAKEWRNRTHHTIHYYKGQKNV